MKLGTFVIGILAAVALAAPSAAAAEPASGTLTVEGPVALGDGARVEAAPLAVLLDDAAGLATLEIRAAAARVCFYTAYVVEGSGVAAQWPQLQGGCEERTSVVLTAGRDASASGWLGAYPGPGSRVDAAWSRATAESRPPSTLRSPGQATGSVASDPGATFPFYDARIDRPFVQVDGVGALRLAGPGAVKFLGPAVHLSSSQGSADYATGERSSDGAIQSRARSWLYVSFDDATLDLSSVAPVALATAEAHARAGDVQVRALGGSLRAGPATYRPAAGEADVLRGDLSATLSPDSGGSASRMDVEGQLAFTTFVRERAGPLPFAGPSGAAPLGLVAVGAVVAGGGAVAWARRRRRGVRVSLSAAACLEEARNAELARDPERALAWARRAAQAEPEDGAILLELAWHLDHAGQAAEALAAHAAALRLAAPHDGRAHLEMAFFLAKRMLDVEGAEAEIVEALRRDPALLAQVFMEEEVLAALSGRSAFERAVRRAEAHDDASAALS